MHAAGLPFLRSLAPWAPVVLRVTLGVIMAAHGWQKLSDGPAGFGGMLDGLGFPLPTFFAWVTALAELFGGLALIAGLFTRLAALGFVVLLGLATILVKVDIGFLTPAEAALPGAEFDLALIAGMVGLALLGPGTLSVDQAIGVERDQPTARTPGLATRS